MLGQSTGYKSDRRVTCRKIEDGGRGFRRLYSSENSWLVIAIEKGINSGESMHCEGLDVELHSRWKSDKSIDFHETKSCVLKPNVKDVEQGQTRSI